MVRIIRNLLLLILLTSFQCSAFAVSTTVQGNAFYYKGQTIEVRRYLDLFTYQSIVLDKAEIPGDGSFRFNVDVSEEGIYLLKIGRVHAHLFVEPGVEYTIILSEPFEGNRLDLAKDIFILPEIFETGGDLNTKVTEMEKSINGFIIENSKYYGRGVNRKILPPADSLVKVWEEKLRNDDNAFFKAYGTYRLASFELQTNHSRKEIFTKYFEGKSPAYEQLSYSNAFELLFANYFEYLNPVRAHRFQDDADTAIQNVNYHRLFECMSVDPFLQDEELRELLLVSELYKLGHGNKYPLDNIMILLDSAIMNVSTEACKGIAANAQQSLSRLAPGSLAPDFEFADFVGNIYRLSEYEGRHIYIQFFDHLDAETLRQMSLMKVLKDGYGTEIAMFSISTKESITRMKMFAEKYDFEWFFGLAVSPDEVADSYDLRAMPSYYYLDEDLKFIKSPAPPPGANIEKLFAKEWNAQHPNKALHFKLQPPKVEEDSTQTNDQAPK